MFAYAGELFGNTVFGNIFMLLSYASITVPQAGNVTSSLPRPSQETKDSQKLIKSLNQMRINRKK